MDKLGDLSDEELLARLRSHVGEGSVWCAQPITYLVEVDERRLDRVHACSSMWDFCTRKLGMSEGEAHRRIAAARTVRRFPQVLGALARGEIHLCALYALRKHLTIDNVDEPPREASGKSTREVEKMVAARFPRPDIPACVEPVAPQALLSPLSPASVVAPPSDAAPAWSLSLAASPSPGARTRIEPLSATRYRIELTVSAATKDAIDRIKDLMRHRNPTGELSTILDASLALLLAQLEKERLGKTPRPRRRKPPEVTNACASSATAHAGHTTRSPTAPVPKDLTANEQAAPARMAATTQAPQRLARPADVHSETGTHAPHELEREVATADDPAPPACSEARTNDPHELEREVATADDPGIRVRSDTRTRNRTTHVHADAPNGAHGVSSRGPANAEPSTAEPADVEALLCTDVTHAASTPPTELSRPGSRYVPAELRREVFARDGERCTYVGPDGDRCPARGFLELDHIHPKAHGGAETAANLRVRCRAHNALYAEQVFGRAHVEGRRHLRHGKYAPPPPASFETAIRGLRSLGFREPEARRALEPLATRRDMQAASVETILREALLVLT